jgi:hypothetical protein
MKKLLFKQSLLSLFLYFIANLSFAQNGATQQGFTVTGIKGVTKTIPELTAYEAAHPPLPYIQGRKKKEHDANLHRVANPNALNVSEYSLTPNVKGGTATNTPTQTIWSNFLGLRQGDTPGWVPPDVNGDVGTTQLCVTANGRIRFYTKPTVIAAAVTTPTGTSNTEPTEVWSMDSDAFFTDASIGVTIGSDPHVRFDRLSQRWFILQISLDQSKNNYCQIAVSSGPTITNLSSFTFYSFRPSGTGGGNQDFFDYPTLGIDSKYLYIGGNMFSSSVGCNMYVVNKTNILAGTLTVTAFNRAATGTDIWTPQGVHNDDPGATEGYFIGSSNTTYSKLVMRRVIYSATYPAGVPTISADIVINTQTTAAPSACPNKGGQTIDALDGRPFAAMIKKNKITGAVSLWTAITTRMTAAGVGSGSGNRDGAIWFEIGTLTATPTILRSASFFDAAATNPIWYINSSIAMSGQGHCVISHTSAGNNNYAQVTVAGRYRTDAPSTAFQASVDATTTTSSYSDGSGARWGDFSQTVVDPTDDMTMWTFGEYAQGTTTWGVRAVQLKAPPPPAAFTLTPAPTCGTHTITMDGTSVNNSEFFDPGAGYINRLAVAVTGPSAVTVTNVTFVSPTQITADITLPPLAAAGTYTVTVTNPDGQTTTTTFNLASPCAPVPVALVSFTGKPVNKTVELNWRTTSEFNFKNYDVEKSADGINFQNLVQVAARGGANVPANYATVDHYPYPNYSYYRLKTINIDGSYAYSEIVRVKTENRAISLTRLFPNPTSSFINYEIVAANAQTLSVEIFDIAGRKMMNQTIHLSQGINEKQLNLTNMSAGSYIIQFKDAQDNVIEKAKVIKN